MPQGCPPIYNKKEGKKPQAVGQAFYVGKSKEEDTNAVVSATLLLDKTYTYVLFDSGVIVFAS